jgi:group I intron endonuclease
MRIYLTVNLVNHKIYVGQKLSEGREHYIGGGTKIRAAVRSLGREKFSHETLMECGDDTDITNAWECFYIKLFNAQDPECGYNIENGGKSFHRHTPEMKAHMSNVMKGNTNMKKGTPRSALNLIRVAEAKRKMRGIKQRKESIIKRVKTQRDNGKGRVAKRCLTKDQFENMILDYKSGVRQKDLVKKYPVKPDQLSRILSKKHLYANWKKPFEPIKIELCLSL